jgi:hypothetical protein
MVKRDEVIVGLRHAVFVDSLRTAMNRVGRPSNRVLRVG